MAQRGVQPRVLPFIRDLNPQLDDFVGLVGLAQRHQGQRAKLAKAIEQKWKKDGKRKGFTRHSIEANIVTSLGPENLGIIDDTTRLTALGKRLQKLRNRPDEFKDALAIHLLKNRAGWQFARALDVFQLRGRRPRRGDIAEYLGEKYGLQEWRDLNNISSLHSFLEWCGVVSKYRLNSAEFDRLLGTPIGTIAELERFTVETRAYLEALVRLGGSATAHDMRVAAEAHLRRQLDPHKVPATLEPLIDAGLVKFTGRRGQRTGTYAVVDAKKASLLADISSDLASVGAIPDEVFEHDFAWVVARLDDDALSRDEKGRTLEVLAGMMCWKLGLRHLLFREKSPYEVDVSAEYLAGGYQKWIAQCKAFGRSQVRSEHILREFGIATLEHCSALLFVTTADFTPDAVFTAERIMRQSPIQVLLVNGDDLDQIAKDETALYSMVGARSAEARQLRSGDPPWIIFQELDAMKDWILREQPDIRELWLQLEKRDITTTQSLVATIVCTWLEGQRAHPDFDKAYADGMTAHRHPA